MQPDRRSPPLTEVATRQRFITRSAPWTIPGTLLGLGAAYALLPPLAGLAAPADRLALAARWLVIALVPYVAVCLTIAGTRFFQGAHDPLAGLEGERLRIHCRVMQNTLEQLVWLATCLLAAAPLLRPAEARIVPIVCCTFAAARFLFWWGYLRQRTLGRAPGVQITFTMNVGLLALVAALWLRAVLA
jgi:uncharacterized membrane protein YecN with MAPEG domain